ncbi:hypothetical protein EUGRSUZ_J01667 [Eucalyptus grandis]|uniref:Uncharacterized protein n=2 Tax=Eucalyptus grandis TaxID=71139 RepID=A0A059ADS0_EUCGR|nr:hypothetical protein EUGRSUZ_J01667 [Eucalyptus grandis]
MMRLSFVCTSLPYIVLVLKSSFHNLFILRNMKSKREFLLNSFGQEKNCQSKQNRIFVSVYGKKIKLLIATTNQY